MLQRAFCVTSISFNKYTNSDSIILSTTLIRRRSWNSSTEITLSPASKCFKIEDGGKAVISSFHEWRINKTKVNLD